MNKHEQEIARFERRAEALIIQSDVLQEQCARIVKESATLCKGSRRLLEASRALQASKDTQPKS
jgi:hypothetical protein